MVGNIGYIDGLLIVLRRSLNETGEGKGTHNYWIEEIIREDFPFNYVSGVHYLN